MMRGAFGNLGHQVQDVAVQLQMGTSATRVFTQQGSQIAGAFGPTGAIVGGILAVGGALLTSLIPSLVESEKKMKALKKAQGRPWRAHFSSSTVRSSGCPTS